MKTVVVEYGTAELDWPNLGFSYRSMPYRFRSDFKSGHWLEGGLITDNHIMLSEGATALNYGQQVFEGMKARTLVDGRVALFRPQENAARLQRSAERLMMEPIPEDLFINAAKEVVRANAAYVPPYGTDSAFYLRPLLLGVGGVLGVRAALDFTFVMYGQPVGPYFSGEKQAVRLLVNDFDRAATRGVGDVKAGGNYAGTLQGRRQAKKLGYDEVLYLDSETRSYIDEVGAANFFAIKNNTFITPKSPTILPGITRNSLMTIAEKLGMKVEYRPVALAELETFEEVACCGTAAVIAPISEIKVGDRKYHFKAPGEKTKALYSALTAIQFGRPEALPGFEDWLVEV